MSSYRTALIFAIAVFLTAGLALVMVFPVAAPEVPARHALVRSAVASTAPARVAEADMAEWQPQDAGAVREPVSVVMPDVIGDTLPDAETTLIDAGFTELDYRDCAGENGLKRWDASWIVREQNPAAGESVMSDTQVRLCAERYGDDDPEPSESSSPDEGTADDDQSPTSPSPSPSGGDDNEDQRFDTCAEANAAGYGDYVRGQDVEYDWYEDRDNDGVVCERN
ncbi:excalibur calcium-binding domain-containing protein [Acrocarpospora pleiomorpha]|nr:excalibur calcium-binding domain-containing protein [Acrocarpospora pleiomorpha]